MYGKTYIIKTTMGNNRKIDISQRACKSNEPLVDSNTYATGMIGIIDFLFADLTRMLEAEGRKFGIVNTYLRVVTEAIDIVQSAEDYDDDLDSYGKILFLFKPVLKKEFGRLTGNRKLSSADANICIIKRLVELTEELTPEYDKMEFLLVIKEVIMRLWSNIRGNSKKDSLFYMSYVIRKYMSEGIVGRHVLRQFTIDKTEEPKEKLIGDPIRFCNEINKPILEISM